MKTKHTITVGNEEVKLKKLYGRSQLKKRVRKLSENIIEDVIEPDCVNLFVGLAEGCSPFFEDLIDNIHRELDIIEKNSKLILLQTKVKVSLYGNNFMSSLENNVNEEGDLDVLSEDDSFKLHKLLNGVDKDSKVNVIIVDDLWDSGLTMNLVRFYFKSIFNNENVTINDITTVTLFLKIEDIDQLVPQSLQNKLDLRRIIPNISTSDLQISPDYCSEILSTSKWLVGYGMDYKQQFRGIKKIYTVESMTYPIDLNTTTTEISQ